MDRNKELAIAAKSGNKESLETLFKNNQGVVVLYAKHYVSSYVPLADLKQASYLALLEAVKSYDPDSGWYFITYFKVWMRHFFVKECKNNSLCISLEGSRDLALLEVSNRTEDEECIKTIVLTELMNYIKKCTTSINFKVIYEHIILRKSYAEIGRELGIGRDRVRLRELRVFKKLRNDPFIRGIATEYLDNIRGDKD